jgi:hypothetical protein
MNIELISSLARIRSDELLRAAAIRSILVRAMPERAPRKRLAQAVRTMGYFALRLGDALAESR